MNIKNIKSLAQILESSGLTAIEVSEGDSKIRLEKKIIGAFNSQSFSQSMMQPPMIPSENKAHIITEKAVDFNNIKEIKSPMVGVFYGSPAPDAQAFVKVGSKVKKGDVLCIIEAMKLMNEIVAEIDGEIVDICVENGQVVEFSQILYKLF